MSTVAGPSARPRRYLDLAQSYAEVAARLADTRPHGDAPAPLYMLVAHAMELALKAAIARSDCDDERLMLLGHDLPLCLRAATADGLELERSADIEAIVEALAMPHLAQALRYPAYLSWPLPGLGRALEALAVLMSRVEAFVGE